jgi:hypothetical protein
MSFEQEDQRPRSGSVTSAAHDDATPGKRTLTQGLTPAVQRSTGSATADPAPAGDSAQPAAIHGGGNRLERVFGGHPEVQRTSADAPSTAGASSGASSGGHVTETTIPFTAVIKRSSDEGGGGGASDGKPAPASASGEPAQAQPPGTSDPQGNAPLYIAQMGGAETLKQTNADAVAAAISYKPTTTPRKRRRI